MPAPRVQRNISRAIHIVVALVIGTYVYAPEHVSDGLRPFLMFAGIPLATLSGVFQWKQASIRRLLNGGRGQAGGGSASVTVAENPATSGVRDVG